jgi:hypothetical protein
MNKCNLSTLLETSLVLLYVWTLPLINYTSFGMSILWSILWKLCSPGHRKYMKYSIVFFFWNCSMVKIFYLMTFLFSALFWCILILEANDIHSVGTYLILHLILYVGQQSRHLLWTVEINQGRTMLRHTCMLVCFWVSEVLGSIYMWDVSSLCILSWLVCLRCMCFDKMLQYLYDCKMD